MPRKLRIILWVAVGLTIATILVTMSRASIVWSPFMVFFLTMLALILACGILIVYWTKKNIKQVALKRYLLLAGASAMGMLFFEGMHFFTEAALIMILIVCPVSLIVGAVMALKFKSASAV